MSVYPKKHHLRPTTSSYQKQCKRVNKFVDGLNENGDYFTLNPCAIPVTKSKDQSLTSNENFM